jgi:hypothetical protein
MEPAQFVGDRLLFREKAWIETGYNPFEYMSDDLDEEEHDDC